MARKTATGNLPGKRTDVTTRGSAQDGQGKPALPDSTGTCGLRVLPSAESNFQSWRKGAASKSQ